MKIANCKLKIENCDNSPLSFWERVRVRAASLHSPLAQRKNRNASAPGCRHPICNFQFAIFSLQFLLCLLFLAGCHKQAATTPQQEAPEEAVPGQYHEELLQLAVDNLNRLEEFNSRDVLEQIIERLNSRNQPKPNDESGKHFDPLLSSWPEPEMLRQVVDRLNQWIRTQPPPADWKLDPMVSSLPKPLMELPEIKDLGQMEFSRFDGYALQEAVWLRDVSRSGARRPDRRRGAGKEPFRLDGPQHPT